MGYTTHIWAFSEARWIFPMALRSWGKSLRDLLVLFWTPLQQILVSRCYKNGWPSPDVTSTSPCLWASLQRSGSNLAAFFRGLSQAFAVAGSLITASNDAKPPWWRNVYLTWGSCVLPGPLIFLNPVVTHQLENYRLPNPENAPRKLSPEVLKAPPTSPIIPLPTCNWWSTPSHHRAPFWSIFLLLDASVKSKFMLLHPLFSCFIHIGSICIYIYVYIYIHICICMYQM